MKKLIFNLTILLSVCLVQQQDINCAAKVLSTSEISLNDQFIKLINEHDWPKAEKMLSNGADINYQDSTGKTALMHAGINSDSRIVNALLNRGANHALPDFQGRKFADYIDKNTVLTGIYNEFLRTKGLTGIKEHKETKNVSASDIGLAQVTSDISTSTNSSTHKIKYLTEQIEAEKHIRDILDKEHFYEVLQNEILHYLMKPHFSLLKELIGGHHSGISSLCALPNGNLASGYWGTIKIWDMHTGTCLQILADQHTSDIHSLCLLENGNLASGSKDNTIKIWDINTGACLKTLTGHTHSISSLCTLPNGNLASGSVDDTIKIWDINTGDCLKTLTGHTHSISSLCILPNDKLASGSYDNIIKIWDINTGICLQTLTGHTNSISSLCTLPNDKLASGSWDHTIKIWDINTGICLQTLTGHTQWVSLLCALPNDKLASGSWDHTIKIWDINTGTCLQKLTGHDSAVTALCILPNGDLASGSYDCTIKIWSNKTLDLI